MRSERVHVPVTGLPGQSYLESVANQGPSRSAPIGLALLLHLTIATALTVSATFTLDDSIEAPLPKISFIDLVPPVPSAGPAKPPAERPAQSPPPAQQKVYAPTSIPQEVPVAPAQEPADQPGPAYSGRHVPGGFPSELPASEFPGDPNTVAVAPPDIASPIHITSDVKEPVEMFRVNPVYPEAARRVKLEGVVILQAVITKSGDVESVSVLRGAHPLLDRAALDAVAQWRYRAATLNGRPVAVYLTVTVNFQLR